MEQHEYPTYEAALADCGDGYLSEDLAETIFAKHRGFDRERLRSTSYMFAAMAQIGAAYARPDGRPLRVLDYGGQFGLHFDLVRLTLPRIDLRWAIVETEPFVRRGGAIATAERRWFADAASAVDWLGGVDLALCSGALQSVPDPGLATVDLLGLKAPLVAWQRMALSLAGRPLILVQRSRLADNGPGHLPAGVADREIRYPITYWPEADFLEAHAQHDLLCRLNADESGRINGVPVIENAAYLFARREVG